MANRDYRYEKFRGALRSLIQDQMPWPYTDVARDSDEANDAAWAVMDKYAASLWADMADERKAQK